MTDREQEIRIHAISSAARASARQYRGTNSSATRFRGIIGERTIDVQINRLRRKIERDPSNPVWQWFADGARYWVSGGSGRGMKRGGEALKLTDREQEILAIFAARAGETIPRHELVGDDSEVGERTIDVQINRLRRKIERDPSNPVWLQTVRGIGYRLSVE
jgi:DNA-binding response OmpR family regulator